MFKGHSDTEVILESLASWGVEATVGRLIGMFAFGLWDRKERTLTLARDRLGIKPLYWGRFGGLFLFGSELKALRAHPGWRPQVNRDALTSFMRHNYIPAPMTIYDGISKLQPGCILKAKVGEEPKIESYWSLSEVVSKGKESEIEFSDTEATIALDELLRDAVSSRMVADVPLGAFLSGGIDSSTVNSGSVSANNKSPTANDNMMNYSFYKEHPGIGRHSLRWLERSTATGTTTWYGDQAAPSVYQSGIIGEIWG